MRRRARVRGALMIRPGQRWITKPEGAPVTVGLTVQRVGKSFVIYQLDGITKDRRMKLDELYANWHPEPLTVSDPGLADALSLIIRTLGDVERHSDLTDGNRAALDWAIGDLARIHEAITTPVIGQVYQDAIYPDRAVIPLGIGLAGVLAVAGPRATLERLSDAERIAAANWVRRDFFYRAVTHAR